MKLKLYSKLFAAALPLAGVAAAYVGMDLPADWAVGVMAVATPILVWAFPKNES